MQLYVAPAFSMVPARALALCPALNAESAANLLHFVMASIQPPSHISFSISFSVQIIQHLPGVFSYTQTFAANLHAAKVGFRRGS